VAGTPLRLEWSDRARRQLLEILDYYLEHASAAAAERVLWQIEGRARELAQHPLSGVAVDGLDGTYRRDRTGSYALLYRVLREDDSVRILSVRHGRRKPLSSGEIAELDES